MTGRRERVTIKSPVIINRSIMGEGLDLSAGGMYIYSRVNFLSGSIIEVNFQLDGEPLSVHGKVQHSQPGIGFGMEFIELSDDIADKIKDYLSRVKDEK